MSRPSYEPARSFEFSFEFKSKGGTVLRSSNTAETWAGAGTTDYLHIDFIKVGAVLYDGTVEV